MRYLQGWYEDQSTQRPRRAIGDKLLIPEMHSHSLPGLLLMLIVLLCAQLAMADVLDSDQDGYPDSVEITSAEDRRAFLEWFATIAESQFTAMSDSWEYQDCSGLLRFAFVKALEPKNQAWFEQFPFLTQRNLPEVKSLSYPMPILSRSVFRNSAGSFHEDDIEVGRLVGLASSVELMNHASVYLGRTPDTAQRGDLMFFIHPLAEGSGYHSMIYLGDDMLVYHTGAAPEEGGEVRLLSLATLSRHPDSSWHPVPENQHFLGFYRWKIVD